MSITQTKHTAHPTFSEVHMFLKVCLRWWFYVLSTNWARGQGPQGKSASSVSYFSLETSLTIVQHQRKVDALLSGQVPELLRKKQTLKECKEESLQENVTTRFKSSQSDMPLYKIQEAPIQRLRRSYESTLRKKAQIGEAGEALELESISPKRERFSFMSAHTYIYI